MIAHTLEVEWTRIRVTGTVRRATSPVVWSSEDGGTSCTPPPAADPPAAPTGESR